MQRAQQAGIRRIEGHGAAQRSHDVNPAAHAAGLREARPQALADIERAEILARPWRDAARIDRHDLPGLHELQPARILVHELLAVDRFHRLPVGVVVGLLRHHVGIAKRSLGVVQRDRDIARGQHDTQPLGEPAPWLGFQRPLVDVADERQQFLGR